jgi:protein transport protein SEC61 subunit gamma-like protein
MKFNIKEKLENYARVLKLTKRPTKEEFVDTAKICGIGLVIVGLIGFILFLVSVLFIG